MTWDWFFAPTDNINLIIEIAVGITVTAWIAGQRSKRALVAYLKSDDSNPVVDKIADRVGSKVPKVTLPEIPTVDAIASEVMGRIPAYPDLTQIVDVMTERTGQMLRAYSASQQNELNAWIRTQAGPGGHINFAQDSALETVLTSFTDAKTAKKVGGLYKLLKQHQTKTGVFGSNGGGAPPQQQRMWQIGDVETTPQGTFQLTASGWVPVQPRQPQSMEMALPMPSMGAVPASPPKASEVPPRAPEPAVPEGAQ